MNLKDKQLVVLGETNFRNQRWRFGIKQDDRRRHMYVVGSTGMGKTEFLKNMAIQDIEAGRGVCYIDPHGDASSDLLDYVPPERLKDVVYFDPGDLSFPIAFNVMEKVDYEYRHLVASGLLGVFKKIFGVEAWSGRMEYILNNTILALLEHEGSTLLGINRMMADKEYRKKVVAEIKDPIVKTFWVNEFAKYADKFATEATAAIQNKIGQFISNNLIRNIIGQPQSTIDVRKIMDEGKILIVNISRGKIGEDGSRLLGALLVTKIQLAAMSRVDIPEEQRRDFYLYVDEFQHFATESFANILSEARKFHLNLVMAHQYIKQMEEPVMDAVFGNVGTIVSFRVGAEDGEFLEKWFQPDFMMNDIVNLGKYSIYIKLMIDGVSSKGFSASTIQPLPKLEKSHRDEIIDYSRKTYATPRASVEKDVAEWVGMREAEANLLPKPQERNDYGPQRPPRESGAYQPPRNNNYVTSERNDRPASQTFQRNNHGPEQRMSPQSGNNNFNNLPFRQQSNGGQQSFRPTQQPPRNYPAAHQIAPRQQAQPQQAGISLDQALKSGPVNFHGKRLEEKREKAKVEVNTDELRKVLEEAMKKKG